MHLGHCAMNTGSDPRHRRVTSLAAVTFATTALIAVPANGQEAAPTVPPPAPNAAPAPSEASSDQARDKSEPDGNDARSEGIPEASPEDPKVEAATESAQPSAADAEPPLPAAITPPAGAATAPAKPEPAPGGQPPASAAPNASGPVASLPAESSEADLLSEPGSEPRMVTVDRRTRDLQKVPGSAFAWSGEELQRLAVTSLGQLALATPFVEVGEQQGSLELFTRGIGSGGNADQGETAMATYVDGVYLPRPRGLRTPFYDVERLEVVLGPQGALRGRNALGGSLEVVTKTPKLGEWEGHASLQLGSFAQRLVSGAVNVPFGESFAVRVATVLERRDPFYVNQGGAPLLRAAEDADAWSYRIAGRWLPADGVSVTVRFDDSRERGTGSVGSDYSQLLRHGLNPSEAPNPRAVSFVGNQPSLDVRHWGLSTDIEVDFGDFGLSALSSYRDLRYDQHTGANGGVTFPGMPRANLDSYADSVWHTTSRSYFNELRLFASDASRLQWTAGFFHFHEVQSVFLGQVLEDQTGSLLGSELNLNDVPTGALAGFADVTVDLTEAFRAVAGFRLTSEHKERHGIQGNLMLQCNQTALAQAQSTNPDATCLPPNDPTFGGTLRWGTPGFQFAGGQRTDFGAGNGNDTLAGVESRVETFSNGVQSWGSGDNLRQWLAQPGADVGTGYVEQNGNMDSVFPDFRLGTEWDLGPLSLLYLTFTTGHRSGGVNDSVATETSRDASRWDTLTYAPETVYSTELGSKNVLLGRRLVLNGAAFWYAYSGYQAMAVVDLGPGMGTTVARNNVGDARVLGIQAEAVGYLPQALVGKLGVALLEARFADAQVVDTRVAASSSGPLETNLKGNFLPRAPQLALSYGISRSVATDLGDFEWSVSGQTKSSMFMTPFNGQGVDSAGRPSPTSNDRVPWTTRLDAAVGYVRVGGDVRVDAFVVNLTDMTYVTSLINSPNTNVRFLNSPRQFGLRVSMYL